MPATLETTRPTAGSSLVKIPAFPPIAVRLLHLLSNENVALSEILEPLRADPAFSAEILRRANSALFGFSSQVGSLQHALVVLGLRRVRSLTVTVATGVYLKKALQIEELRRCWRHTLACALLAEELARACLVHMDLAYTAGLLHDIGRLGLLVAKPEQYSAFLRAAAVKAATPDPFDLLDYEKETFGLDHCEAGNVLSGEWNLPQEFAVITGRHHDRPEGTETDLLRLVHLGCQLADTLGFHVVNTGRFMDFGDIRAALPEAARHRLLSDPDALRELVEGRIRALDLDQPAPPPAAEPALPQPPEAEEDELDEDASPPAQAPAPAPPAEAAPPPSSTVGRDLLLALVTFLLASVALFLLFRALS